MDREIKLLYGAKKDIPSEAEIQQLTGVPQHNQGFHWEELALYFAERQCRNAPSNSRFNKEMAERKWNGFHNKIWDYQPIKESLSLLRTINISAECRSTSCCKRTSSHGRESYSQMEKIQGLWLDFITNSTGYMQALCSMQMVRCGNTSNLRFFFSH